MFELAECSMLGMLLSGGVVKRPQVDTPWGGSCGEAAHAGSSGGSGGFTGFGGGSVRSLVWRARSHIMMFRFIEILGARTLLASCLPVVGSRVTPLRDYMYPIIRTGHTNETSNVVEPYITDTQMNIMQFFGRILSPRPHTHAHTTHPRACGGVLCVIGPDIIRLA